MNNMLYKAKRKDIDEQIRGLYFKTPLIAETFNAPAFGDKVRHCIADQAGYTFEIIPKSLAMYTGLKDRNGKRIFGSIPVDGEMSKGGSIIKSSGKNIFKVEYYERWAGFWIIPIKDKGARTSLTIYDAEIVQVIGNQFDNPELLE